MEFKLLEIEDKCIVEKYFSEYGKIHCDFCLTDYLCALEKYKPKWCIYHGFFIVQFITEENKLAYLQPLGNGNLTDIIHILENDSSKLGYPITIICATEEFISCMKNKFPDWGFASDRRCADYIYNVDDLKYLKGSGFHSKRQLIRQFKSRYKFRYEELKPYMFEDCIALEKTWIRSKLSDINTLSLNRFEKDFNDELNYIEAAFKYYDTLSMLGGAIYVDNELVAFTFGSAINNETFCTRIQKADISYKGIYAMIDNQLISHLPENFKFVNAGWDCGVHGLRLAKKLYNPIFLSEEIVGRRFSNEEIYIRDLLLTCFPQHDKDFANSFILNRYSTLHSFSRKIDGHIVSIIFLVQFEDIAYLYLGMTSPEHRKKGLFKSVLQEAVDYCRTHNFKYITLIPTEGHADWFAKRGFTGNYHFIFNPLNDFYFGTGNTSIDIGCVMFLNGNPLKEGYEIVLTENEVSFTDMTYH